MGITFPRQGPTYDELFKFVRETQCLPEGCDTRIQIHTYGPYSDFRQESSSPSSDIYPETNNVNGQIWGLRIFRGFIQNHCGVWRDKAHREHATDAGLVSRLYLQGVQIYPFDEKLAGTECIMLFMSTNHPIPTYSYGKQDKHESHHGWILSASRMGVIKQEFYWALPKLPPVLIDIIRSYHNYHFDLPLTVESPPKIPEESPVHPTASCSQILLAKTKNLVRRAFTCLPQRDQFMHQPLNEDLSV